MYGLLFTAVVFPKARQRATGRHPKLIVLETQWGAIQAVCLVEDCHKVNKSKHRVKLATDGLTHLCETGFGGAGACAMCASCFRCAAQTLCSYLERLTDTFKKRHVGKLARAL